MNSKIYGIILIVVALGVGLYLVNSGGLNKFGSLLTPPNASSTISPAAVSSSATSASSSSGLSWSSFFQSLFAPHSFSNLPTVGSVNGGSSQTYINSGSGSGGGSNAAAVTPPAGFTAAQLSPYYQEVRFGGISSGEISLTTYPSYGAPTTTVDVTGWEIKTNRSGEFIPQAVNVYYPTGQNLKSDIVLALNQTNYVNIYSNASPENIRINACMGYLNTPAQFNPGFSYDCPAPDRSQITQFTGACQNYILSLSDCQSPDFDSYYFPKNDYQCEDYLEGKFNYDWCVSTYATQPDFLSNEWRIWTDSTPLDPYHDNVELLDKDGLLVDIYSY